MNYFCFFSLLIPASIASMDALRRVLIDHGALWRPHGSPGGSIPDKPTAETLANLSPVIKTEYTQLAQVDSDFARFAPDWLSMNETTPLGVFELGDIIIQKHDVTLFHVRNRPGMVIKYMHDCMDGPFAITPHPLAKEVWLQNNASEVNITDRVLFLSPPSAIPLGPISPKIDFNISSKAFTECFFAGGSVRYSIQWIPSGASMRRLVFPASRLFSKTRFKFAMDVGANLIVLLKKLHKQEIVHGNLGRNNVLVHFGQNETISLELQNFYFAQPVFGRQVLPIRYGRVIDQSPWEMNEPDHRYDQRDDIFRALKIVAELINPIDYLRRQLALSATDLARWRLEGNIFNIPGSADSNIDHLAFTDDMKAQIKSELENILLCVRSEVDPYDKIALAFTELSRLADM